MVDWTESWERQERDKKSESLIKKYRETGDKEYLDSLLLSFKPFIKKYVKLLKYGQFYKNDRDVLYLLSLLNPDKKKLTEVSNYISGIFFRWDKEDIYQELYRIFLYQVKLYKKKKGVGFNGYIYNTFHFRVKILIESLAREILNVPNKVWLCENMEALGERFTDSFEEKSQLKVDMESFGGYFPFLKNCYVEGYSNVDVAKLYGIHRNTSWEYREYFKELFQNEFSIYV